MNTPISTFNTLSVSLILVMFIVLIRDLNNSLYASLIIFAILITQYFIYILHNQNLINNPSMNHILYFQITIITFISFILEHFNFTLNRPIQDHFFVLILFIFAHIILHHYNQTKLNTYLSGIARKINLNKSITLNDLNPNTILAYKSRPIYLTNITLTEILDKFSFLANHHLVTIEPLNANHTGTFNNIDHYPIDQWLITIKQKLGITGMLYPSNLYIQHPSRDCIGSEVRFTPTHAIISVKTSNIIYYTL